MQPETAAEIYSNFIVSVIEAGAAYSVQCKGDPVAVYGAGLGSFPLWPDKKNADYFVRRYWPDLRPARLSLRRLLDQLPMVGVLGLPAGIGLSPWPEAVVVPAMVLFEDLVCVMELAAGCLQEP